MAIVATPSSFAARMTRMAISPRLAISSRRILGSTQRPRTEGARSILVGQILAEIVLEAAAAGRIHGGEFLQRLLRLGLEFARQRSCERHDVQAVVLVLTRDAHAQRRKALLVLAQLAQQSRRRRALDILELEFLIAQRCDVRALRIDAVEQLADALHRIEQLGAPVAQRDA